MSFVAPTMPIRGSVGSGKGQSCQNKGRKKKNQGGTGPMEGRKYGHREISTTLNSGKGVGKKKAAEKQEPCDTEHCYSLPLWQQHCGSAREKERWAIAGRGKAQNGTGVQRGLHLWMEKPCVITDLNRGDEREKKKKGLRHAAK